MRTTKKRSKAGQAARGMLRLGVMRGLRSVEVDPEAFRKELSEKHGVWVPNFERMDDIPIEQLDAIAAHLIRSAGKLALVEGVGFGFGGALTLIPDTSFLVVITLRLIQRLSLLYGFHQRDSDQRLEMWKAAAAASGVDYGKDLAEKQLLERLAPRIAKALATKIGAEAAEKWAGRLIPLASSAIGGALNFTFVRAWGRRAQRQLREDHMVRRRATTAIGGVGPAEALVVS